MDRRFFCQRCDKPLPSRTHTLVCRYCGCSGAILKWWCDTHDTYHGPESDCERD